jgi:hypothetical protein
VLHILVELP